MNDKRTVVVKDDVRSVWTDLKPALYGKQSFVIPKNSPRGGYDFSSARLASCAVGLLKNEPGQVCVSGRNVSFVPNQNVMVIDPELADDGEVVDYALLFDSTILYSARPELKLAIIAGDAMRVSRVLEASGDADEMVRCAVFNYETNLTQACFLGHHDVVDVLLRASKDKQSLIETYDEYGSTALHSACRAQKDSSLVVRALLDAVDDPFEIANMKSREGDTPLSFACEKGNVETVRLLLPYTIHVSQIPLDQYDEGIQQTLRRALRRMFWAYLCTFLPDDLVQAAARFL